MKFTTIAILVLISYASCAIRQPIPRRYLNVKETTDDCYNNFKGVEKDIRDIVEKAKSADLIGMIPSLIDAVPRILPLVNGPSECYGKIIRDVVGPKCVGNVVDFIKGIEKFAHDPNPMSYLPLINDLVQALSNCKERKVSLSKRTPVRYNLKMSVDECVEHFAGEVPNIILLVEYAKGFHPFKMAGLLWSNRKNFRALLDGPEECYKRVIGFAVKPHCVINIVKFLKDGIKFRMLPMPSNLVPLIIDLVKGISACTHKDQLMSGDKASCASEINAVVSAAPAIIGHVTNSDYIALIGDFTSMKPHLDNILKTCVVSSAECSAKQSAIMAKVSKTFADFTGGNEANVGEDAKAVVEAALDWKSTCFAQ